STTFTATFTPCSADRHGPARPHVAAQRTLIASARHLRLPGWGHIFSSTVPPSGVMIGVCRSSPSLGGPPVMPTVNVRSMGDDVEAAVAFYTTQLGFTLISKTLPAFADVARGDLRLLLSGPASSAGRPMPDGRRPGPGGWNRIHLIVDDLEAEVARLRSAGVRFRNEILTGPGGSQIVLDDPSGNPIELFVPRRPRHPAS